MKIMRDCYPLIRKFINSADPVHSAKDIKETWPLLFRKEHLLDHLHRLTGVQLEGKLSNIPRDVLLLLTSFLRSNTGNDRVVEWSLKVTHAETNLGHKDAASLGLIPLIVSYFKDDLDYLIQVHEASTEMTEDFLNNLPLCPVIVALGGSIFQCTCHLFVDRERVVSSISLKVALEYLFAVYYCLNIKYSPRVGATLEFLQRYLVGISQEEGTKQEKRLKGVRSKVLAACSEIAIFKKKWSSVQQQRLEEDRLMRSLVERLLLPLMPAAAQGPPPPQ
ncbi:hypothetical protein HPB50_011362 [Hyalomma asiaticum]|uniref:Uncharacterized protein n=1 Tax=Hyalomma asiaticum TaxID=266040 RepID=A0ACB7TIC3_HYAAI|nr:hypothetical protein HPB50_011362 [Hyalomma asiaticum]